MRQSSIQYVMFCYNGSMKYLKQFLIILAISAAGEVIRYFVPLPIPASIYGVLMMLVLLISGIVKLEDVRECAEFLIAIMAVMFIPAAAGLIDSYASLKPVLLPALLIIIISTVLTAAVSGKTAQWLIVKKEGGRKDE
mgnify:CR=1 FL=1